MSTFVWLCVIAWHCLPCNAQSKQVQNWTTEEGLPQNSVHALLQSSDGYLWLATEKGVGRFNGLRFTRYFSDNQPAFESDDVCCLSEEQGGTMLFGTASGVVAEKGNTFQRIDGIRSQVVVMQREPSGSVLVLTTDGLVRVRSRTIEAVALPGNAAASALGPAADGSVLVAAGTSLFRFEGGPPKAAGMLPFAPTELAQDTAGQIWLVSTGEVVAMRSGTQAERRWSVGRDLPGSRVQTLRLWPGGVLVGTNRGAVVLSNENAPPEIISQVSNNAVLSTLVDREGNAWFGTDSAGLFALRERVIGTVPGLAGEAITALTASSDGTMWAGTRDVGLRRWKGSTAATVPVPGLASDVVLALAADSANGVWVGSPEGLDHLQANGITKHLTAADGLPDDFVRSLLALPDGTVWVGTRRGAAELRQGRVARVLTTVNGLPSDGIGAMLRDHDGPLWIGTTAGLVRQRGNAVERIMPEDHRKLTITFLLQTADDTTWVGTAEGLFIVRGDRLMEIKLPLLHHGVAAMLEDATRHLWFRTPDGIVRATANELPACAGQSNCGATVRQYGVGDGMPSVELASLGYPAAVAANGSLWFATRRGVATLLSSFATTSSAPPGIVVEQVLLDEQSVPFQAEVQVDAGRRRVAISFAGLSLRSPGQVRYRFQMQGFDGDWSPWGIANVAEYTNLPPGKLLFRVQAMNADGIVSAEDATLHLRVRAPLYRTWWFYVLLLLIAAGLAYVVYRLRLRRVQRNYEAVLQERNRIAREIHDTLAQDFVSVSLQLEVTQQLLQVGATGAAQEQVNATRTLVRDGIQDARESIWALRAGGTEATLPSRLAGVVQRTDHTALAVTGAYRALPASREREVFRIAKEAIGNAVRHGKPANITVDLVYSEDAVLLRVSDDGAGFDIEVAQAKAGHYGVRGMRERAAAMGGVLTIQSEPGRGACVELRLSTSGKQGAE